MGAGACGVERTVCWNQLSPFTVDVAESTSGGQARDASKCLCTLSI